MLHHLAAITVKPIFILVVSATPVEPTNLDAYLETFVLTTQQACFEAMPRAQEFMQKEYDAGNIPKSIVNVKCFQHENFDNE